MGTSDIVMPTLAIGILIAVFWVGWTIGRGALVVDIGNYSCEKVIEVYQKGEKK